MKIVIYTIFCLLSISAVYAQQSDLGDNKNNEIHLRITAGLNIGGLAPVPLPNTIREIKSFNPGFNPSVGVEALYFLNNHWSVGVNPRLDYKGMKVTDRVMYFHTKIQVGQGSGASSFEGAFSGTNYTDSKNIYFGVPVFVEFTPGESWHYRLGGYFAILQHSKFEGTVSDGYIRNGGSLGEKVEISSASFDFADEIRKTDYGIYAGVNKNINKRFSIDLSLQWGLRSAFPSSFTGVSFPMYNIYAQLGTGYRFF